MATREEIDEIRQRSDIVKVISKYLNLKPQGVNFVAICPFHPDKKPSFTVSPQKNLFHCFGCGEGGDVFKFLMKIEKLTFPEAVEKLAGEVGISLKSKQDSRRGKLTELNEEVALYFQNTLHSWEGVKARAYLRRRGFLPQIIRHFRLGYAPPGWKGLVNKFKNHLKDLETLGLVFLSKDGRYYDRFNHRIIFPIFNPSGEVIGFAGRALSGEPKYLNIQNTPLFEKGSTLYGLNDLSPKDSDFIVLVEGYTDVIAAYQVGVRAVASMGTALTSHQANLLRRYSQGVIIAYDRDRAGKAASLRGMRTLRNSGLEVKVALLPPGEDPDSLIRKNKNAFKGILNKAVPFHKFYISALIEDKDTSILQVKEEILKEAGEFLRNIKSLPLKYSIIRLLAERLDLPEEEVTIALRSGQGSLYNKRNYTKTQTWGPEEHVLYFLLQGDLTVKRAIAELDPADFRRYRGIIKKIFTFTNGFKLEHLLERLGEEEQSLVRGLALTEGMFKDVKKAVIDSIIGLKLNSTNRALEEVRRKLKEAELKGANTEELQEEYLRLIQKRRSLIKIKREKGERKKEREVL
jgi:DNA primase